MNRKSTLFTFVVVLAVALSASVRVTGAQTLAPVQTVSGAEVAHPRPGLLPNGGSSRWPGKLAFTTAPVSAPREKVVNGADAALTFQRLWFFTNNNTDGASVAVDAAGGVHVGFSAYTSVGGAWPAYYAYCASNCANSASWTTTSVGNLGVWGGYTRLALDAAGHPRLLWYSQTSVSTPGVFQYAECNTACTNSANWAKVTLATASDYPSYSRYFALDQQGRPRYLYTDTTTDHTGTYYDYCDANCTSAAQWHEVQINSAFLLYDFSLVFDSTGGAHVAYRDATNYPDNLGYAECTACSNAAGWHSTLLVSMGSGAVFSLRLDAQNRPRLAFYTGYLGSGDPNNDLLEYVWCNATCIQEANWYNYALGLPANYGAEMDLALDQQGHPHVAYYVDNASTSYGLGYAVCTANCETNTAAWQSQFVETSDNLDASDPIPVKSGCSISSWLEVGLTPSLTLDAAGNPRIGYTAKHYQGGTCTISEDIRLVRFALAGSTTPPVPTPPTSVTLNGPTIGAVNISNIFTATVSPITATTPITYVWQATGQTAQTHTGRGASDTAAFTWPSGATGQKTITVSASNAAGGPVSKSSTITIYATPIQFNHWVYLPVVIK
jgi:hypothetical protein